MRGNFEAQLHRFNLHHELQSEMVVKEVPIHATYEQISWCKSDTLVMWIRERSAVMVTNFSFLIQTCFYLLIVSSLALFIEILMKKWRNRRVICRRNEEKRMNPKLQRRYYSL